MKKIKNWYNKRNEQGSSLLEVIVAVVILAVVGTTLLGGLNSANLAQRKTAQVAFAENQMQMGNDALALTDFTACDSTTVNPYTGVNLPSNVTILSVEVLDPTTSAVTACSAITTTTAKAAESVQQIKLQYTNSATGITRTRTTLKYLQALTTNLSTDCKAAGYSVNTITPSNMQLVAGDSNVASNALSTTCDGLGTDTVWDATTVTGVNGATGVAAYVDAQGYLNFNSAASGSVAGTISVRVNAHDALTGTAAINKSMTVSLLPTISLLSGTTTTWTALQGCGIMPPAMDQPTSNYCTSYNATTTNVRRTFVLTGGSRTNQSTWVPVTSSATQPWKIAASGTTGYLTYDSAQNTYTGTSSLPFTATGGALYHNLSFGSINLVVRPKLTFGTISVAASSCANKQFKATTSSNKCSITIMSVPGTGYVATNNSQYAASISGSSSKTNFSVNDSKVTYSSSTDTYSKAVTFYYKSGTSGALCNGITTGQSDSATIATVTDVVTGASIPVIVSVTC